MKTISIISSLLMGLLFTGCSGVYFSEHIVGHGKITTLSYDASKRASNILYKRVDSNLSIEVSLLINTEIKNLKELQTQINTDGYNEKSNNIIKRIASLNALYYRPIILAENPPQASMNEQISFIAKILDKADINASVGSNTIKMFELNGYNLMLRDSLYRLNEASIIYDNMKVEQYTEMYKAVLDASVNIAKAYTNQQASMQDNNSSNSITKENKNDKKTNTK